MSDAPKQTDRSADGPDRVESEPRPRRGPRIGLRARLGASVVAVAGMTLLASALSWYTYSNIEHLLTRVTRDNVPAINAALTFAEASARMTNEVPLIDIDRTDFRALSEALNLQRLNVDLSNLVVRLDRHWPDRPEVDELWSLFEQVADMQQDMTRHLGRRSDVERRYRQRLEGLGKTHLEFRSRVASTVADIDALVSRYQSLDTEWTLEPVWRRERLILLRELDASVNLIVGLMGGAAALPDPDRVDALRQQFNRYTVDVYGRAGQLPNEPRYEEIRELVRDVTAPGVGAGNVFLLRARDLALRAQIRDMALESRASVARMSEVVQGLVRSAEADAAALADAAEAAIDRGRAILLSVTVLAVLGSIALILLYVGRSIVARLADLAERTRRIASGELDTPVVPMGNDEISDMTEALAVFRDAMAEVQQRSDQLSESEQRLRAILEGSTVGIAILARTGTPLFANTRLMEMMDGRPEIALEGVPVPPPGYTPHASSTTEVLRQLGGGRAWWSLNNAQPVRFEGQDAVILWVYDITDRKHAEQAMKAARDEAETALRELRQTQRSLIDAEKMAALGSLVAGVAHEINTPVGTTLTAATHLARRTRELRATQGAGTMRKSDLDAYLDTTEEMSTLMLNNIQRASDLIRSFKRVAVDQTSEECRVYDLKEYIAEITQSLRPRLSRSAHDLTVDCPEGIEVRGYPGALSQVITNFVMNALVHAFEPDQRGQMRIAARRLPGQRVELTFSDDGAGIAPEARDRIFEPFFTTKSGAGGSGLGLNIVHTIVTGTFKGSITVDEAESGGTRFVLRFPLDHGEDRPAPDQAAD